jgi:hypothetical protein
MKLTHQKFHNAINRFELYHTDDTNVEVLLRHLATSPFVFSKMKLGGTQMKAKDKIRRMMNG